MIDFLSDKKLLIGIGIGIILATVILSGVKSQANLSKSQIEQKASALGMRYPEDFKVINKEIKK